MLTYIIPFIILILVVVFIHEYGHYYFAKKYGVGVTDFSIGFGKEIFGWNDKSGTRWKICWIPLGGYVKFFGDRNVYSQADHQEILEKYSEEDQQKLFTLKPLYQRALIVFGGPLANFILALVIFFSIYTFLGKDFTPAVINEVQKDSPAMVGGLKQDDIILEIDGNEVKSIMDVSKFITMSTSDFIDFKVKRSYDEIILKVKPDMVFSEDDLGNQLNKRMVGIKLGAYNNEINHVKLGPAQAIYHAAHEVYYVSISSLKYIGGMIAGKADTSQLGGPIRIAKISGQVADVGILAFISMMAYISISLGLINLFPRPSSPSTMFGFTFKINSSYERLTLKSIKSDVDIVIYFETSMMLLTSLPSISKIISWFFKPPTIAGLSF